MSKRELIRLSEWLRARSLVLLCLSILLIGMIGCRPLLQRMAESAELKIRSEEKKASESSVAEDSRPMLVVDVTLSMAGYIEPLELKSTRFSETLQIVAGALPSHDLYTFGDRRALPGESIEQILTYQPAGLGSLFSRDNLFVGQHNQDDLLFLAAGRPSNPRPLVFVTDGVYSTPEGNGVQPVFQVLNSLLERGWSLGVFALRSAYYGTRCELIPGSHCTKGTRLFFSEARAQRGVAQFVPMPRCAIPDRPFYILVLAPSSRVFENLLATLRERLRPEAAFLIAGNVSPVNIGGPQVFPENERELPPVYDRKESLRWLMFDRGDETERHFAIQYSVNPVFPVQRVGWEVQVKEASWSGSSFEDWTAAQAGSVTPIEESNAESAEESNPVAQPSRLPWGGFAGRLAELKTSFSYIHGLGEIAHQHSSAIQEITSWEPALGDLDSLYCEYMGEPSGASHESDMLRILLAVDALRRERAEEVPAHLGALRITSTPGAPGEPLAALAQDLGNYSPRGTLLAASLPAGVPQEPAPTATEPSTDGEQKGQPRLILRLSDAKAGRTYRISLVPQPLHLARTLEELTTMDDSDISSANRTFRFGILIQSLASEHLKRIGQRGDLTVYVTLPGH